MATESGTTLLIDRLLNGRYRVIDSLGAGGMGKTYIAQDTGRPGNPTCVVKQLKPALLDPNLFPNARRLFNAEAEVLERLGHHDQIPRLLAYFEEDQEFYLAQEFINGHPLSAEMLLGQRWTEPQVIQLLNDVLQILEFVHSQNAIHRDIKPENIIRREQDKRLVLIDFGAVKQVQLRNAMGSGLVSMTIGIGTPGYMPTEQSKGTPRPSSDLYALGMVTIQALTGLLPSQLREDEEGEVMWRSHAEVTDELADFLTKMVRYHFKHRYKTASEALKALHALTEGGEAASNVSSEAAPEELSEPDYPHTRVNPAQENAKQAPPDFNVPHPPASPMFSHKNAPSTENETEDDDFDSLPTPPSLKRRLAIGGIAVALTGLMTGGGYLVHRHIDRENQWNLMVEAEGSWDSRNYAQCIEKLASIPKRYADIALQAESLELKCKTAYGRQLLVEAQQAAEGDEFLKAIGIVNKISPETPSFEQAQPLMVQWSENVLTAAQNQYNIGKLDTAIDWASSIPESNSVHQKAQDLIAQWQKEWKQNEDALNAAQDALNSSNWDTAIANLDKLTGNYWKEKGRPLRARAVDEQILKDAQALSNSGSWTLAIAEAEKVTTEAGKQKAAPLIEEAKRRRYIYLNPIEEEANLTQDMPSRTYTFEGEADEQFQLTVSSTEFDTEFRILDANGTVVPGTYNDDAQSGDANSELTFKLPQSGEYTVRVTSYGTSPYRSSTYGRFDIHLQRL